MKKLLFFLFVVLFFLLSVLPAYATNGMDAPAANDTAITIVACIAIGLAVGLTVTLLMKRAMSTVRKQKKADIYVKQNSFSLTESRDLFLYSTVTRVRINNSNNNRK